jgi:toxin YoeB
VTKRNLTWTPYAWEEYQYWAKHDKKVRAKVDPLLADIWRSPFEGIGKPEKLKENYAGFWSRRITGEHRLVYAIADDQIRVVGCRFHYAKG